MDDSAQPPQLWSKVAEGIPPLRFPKTKGIAGHVACTGESINIADAYSDPRFSRAVDLRTGYHTTSILCQAVRDGSANVVGVIQCINKKGEG